MSTIALVLETIAENFDKRRMEFTNLRRIVLNYAGTSLEAVAVRMGIPIIYALWEGYVKEVCQLYLEHVEANVTCVADLRPPILAYLWTSHLRPLTGGLNFSRKVLIANLALNAASSSVAFQPAEKEINTKSNLNFKVLEDIATHLCLDISSLKGWEKRLNALVYLRNNIAHGYKPIRLSYSDFNDYANSMLFLMEAFEQVLSTAVNNKAFCRT